MVCHCNRVSKYAVMINDLRVNVLTEIVFYADDTTVINRHADRSHALAKSNTYLNSVQNGFTANLKSLLSNCCYALWLVNRPSGCRLSRQYRDSGHTALNLLNNALFLKLTRQLRTWTLSWLWFVLLAYVLL